MLSYYGNERPALALSRAFHPRVFSGRHMKELYLCAADAGYCGKLGGESGKITKV